MKTKKELNKMKLEDLEAETKRAYEYLIIVRAKRNWKKLSTNFK